MSFFSFAFILFLAIGLTAFHWAPASAKPRVLLGLSAVFYLSWNIAAAGLLLAVVLTAYYSGIVIDSREAESKKFQLLAPVVALLVSILIGIKCAALVFGWWSAHFEDQSLTAAEVIAPLGLSYYVFRTIGYILDVYWERLPAQRDIGKLALFVSFFPQIVSGPIQRADDFFTQTNQIGDFNAELFVNGLRRILLGLVRKIVIADQLAEVVANIHANPGRFSSLELLFGAYCFTFQLYMDFAGLTDIAIGIGLLFGIKGPENFDRPFLASNIQDFWRRYHKSLTSWLTDYLFMPMRMALRNLGELGLTVAVFVNMIAIGLWHGPTWTYFLFGLINAVYVMVSIKTIKRRNNFFSLHPKLSVLRRVASVVITFNLVVLAQVVWRATSLDSALTYLGGILPGVYMNEVPPLRFDSQLLNVGKTTLVLVLICAVEAFAPKQTWSLIPFRASRVLRWSAYYAGIILVLLSYRTTMTFIYAQF